MASAAIRVAEHLSDGRGVDSHFNETCGEEVPQIMMSEPLAASLLAAAGECFRTLHHCHEPVIGLHLGPRSEDFLDQLARFSQQGNPSLFAAFAVESNHVAREVHIALADARGLLWVRATIIREAAYFMFAIAARFLESCPGVGEEANAPARTAAAESHVATGFGQNGLPLFVVWQRQLFRRGCHALNKPLAIAAHHRIACDGARLDANDNHPAKHADGVVVGGGRILFVKALGPIQNAVRVQIA
jgi:hypothetical protein